MNQTDGSDSTSAPGARIAARLPSNQAMCAEFMAFVQRLDVAPVLFQPKDTDDLNSDLCAGRFDRVLFYSTDDLLEAIWNADADLGAWRKVGVEVECISRLTGQSAGGALPVDMYEIQASLSRWRERHRRRKVMAATVLSVLAIGSMAVLLLK